MKDYVMKLTNERLSNEGYTWKTK